MGSSSSSNKSSTYNTSDNRVAADNGAVGISGGGDVSVHMVPDEAFALVGETTDQAFDFGRRSLDAVSAASSDATRTVTDALFRTMEADREETARLLEQAIRIGIPAAAVAYVAARVWR